MKHSSTASRCYMPEHLLFDILQWLPVTSLLRFKSVCKSWFSLIDSPTFIFHHFDRNSGNDNLLGICFDTASVGCRKFCLLSGNKYEMYNNFDCGLPWNVFEEIRLSFSSNGIICLVHYNGNIYLWNPVVKQLRYLLVPFQAFSLFGFGFNVKSNDHKIVRATVCSQSISNTLVEIYSLRADSWRTTIHKDFSLPSRFCKSHTYHITKDGTCFWIAYSSNDDDTDGNVILSFDLNEETYETMPLPVKTVPFSAVIDFLGDKLAYIQGVESEHHLYVHSYYEIWVLHEYGVKDSWNKTWKIGPTYIPEINREFYPLSFISNGEFLLFTEDGFNKNYGSFRLYNLGTEENECLELGQPNTYFLWSIRYTESLFPVKRANN